MKNIKKLVLISVILFFGFLILVNSVSGQDTTVTYVDNDKDPSWYDATHVKTIQEGIDNLTVTGVVNIWDSTYYIENISINKPVSLVGNGTSTTVLEWDNIEPSGLYAMMYIANVDHVNISGLHFNGSQDGDIHLYPTPPTQYHINYTHIFNCLFTNSTSVLKNSIFMSCSVDSHVNYINISNNEFYDIGKYPLLINYAENITFFNNIIQDSYGGIELTNCKNSVVSYNNISYLGDGESIGIPYSTNFSIHNNTMRYGNWTSLYLDSGTNNCTIYSNLIVGFNETGCYGIESYNVLTKDNLFYNNYFNNNQNVYDGGSNIWNTSKTLGTNIIGGPYLGGNYWSDYTGSDTDGDGLGNTNLPYNSSGGIINGGDYLPLLSFIYVDDNADPGWYDATHVHTIQEGIDNASSGGTVAIWAGTYTENVVVNKTISLIGNGTADTIVCNPTGYAIHITVDNVNIRYLKAYVDSGTGRGIKINSNYSNISHCIIKHHELTANSNNNSFYYCDTNITMSISSSYNTFYRCNFSDDVGVLWNAIYNTFTYCNVSCNVRIHAGASYNTFENNSFSSQSNTEGMIVLQGICSNLIIKNNTFDNSSGGIEWTTHDCYPLTLSNNTITGRPIIYVQDESGLNITQDDAGQIIVNHCEDVNIQNINLPNISRSPVVIRYSENCSINNATLDSLISDAEEGIYIYNCNNISIDSFYAVNCDSYVIYVEESNYINITNSTFEVTTGIPLNIGANYCFIDNVSINEATSGNCFEGNNITIINCEITNISADGEWGLIVVGSNNNISNNAISNCYYGIFFDATDASTISGNNLTSNEYGIYFTDSTNNLIYGNYFDNTINAYDDGTNIWNISKTLGTNSIGGPYLGGNYWSNYTGSDTNHDGLGDTDLPYNSSGEIVNGGDYLPLVTFANLLPNITEVYPVNNSIYASRRVRCYIDVTDQDGDTMDISFYENTTGTWIRQYNETVVGTVVYWNYTNATEHDTTYWWKVVVDDGVDSTTSIYRLTTRSKPSQDEGGGETGPTIQVSPQPSPTEISSEVILFVVILFVCIILAAVFVWAYYKG